MEEGISFKINEKIKRELLKHDKEERYKIYDEDDYKTIEEVFDKRTLLKLYDIMNARVIDKLYGVIDAGKESRVYLAIKENNKFAVKIYLVYTTEFRRRREYIIGDVRFRSLKRSNRSMINLWARKEFINLNIAHNNNVSVPKPIYINDNILIMEFIGNEDRAPLLSEYKDLSKEHYEQVIIEMNKLYKARIIHADLSQFNIFVYNGKIILFDLGAGVELSHPKAEYFLIRDINNINRFFLKKGIEVYPSDEVLEKVKMI